MALTNSLNLTAATPTSVEIGGTGLSNPLQHGILVGNGASPLGNILLTDGQVIIGQSGLGAIGATITGGAGISVTNAAGSITIASNQPVSGGIVNVTGTTQAASPFTIYRSNNVGVVTFSLPASPAAGDWVEIVGEQGSFVVTSSGTQTIRLGAVVSAAAGSLTSDLPSDSVKLVALTSGTSAQWRVVYSVGSQFDVA